MHSELLSLYAKSAPRGGQQPQELLTSHLQATLHAVRQVQARIGRIHAIPPVLKEDFWPVAALAGLLHDAGKVADGFRRMVTERAFSWGERHEVLSLGFVTSLTRPELASWVGAGVATHHRALFAGILGATGRKQPLQALYPRLPASDLAKRFAPVRDEPVRALTQWLHTTATTNHLPVVEPLVLPDAATLLTDTHSAFGALKTEWEEVEDDDVGLAAVLLQGAVTMADHLASADAQLHLHQPLDPVTTGNSIDRDLAGKGGGRLREHQRRAARISGDLILRAPTGSGKTESALLWAALQATELAAEHQAVPRVFYVLPYLSSINAMADRLTDLLRAPVGIAHSRAAAYHLDRATTGEDEHDTDVTVDAAQKATSRAAATKLFQETLRVGTPYQLMRGCLLGAAHSSTLLDTANSVFVFDEIHAYDPRRLGYLLACMRLWKRLGGRTAVVSATLPEALEDLFDDSLGHQSTLIEPSGPPRPARHQVHTREHQLTDPPALEEITHRLTQGEAVLVVANNVAHAIDLYKALKPHAEETAGVGSAFLLHSRFKRSDRMRIETAMADRFRAHTASRTSGLVVATQAVEVSLDLDLDVLFTAAAPLEALLQRCGRVNRLGTRPPAPVIVHRSTALTTAGPSDKVDGIYPREPVTQAWQRLCEHEGLDFDESQATAWLEEIYQSPWGTHWRREVEQHREQFTDTFFDFTRPFQSRNEVTEAFDSLFEGTEAILADDRDDYAHALHQTPGAAGRLLAEDFLVPLPHWAGHLSDWDKKLKVRLIEGHYDTELGLTSVHGRSADTYQPGTVL